MRVKIKGRALSSVVDTRINTVVVVDAIAKSGLCITLYTCSGSAVLYSSRFLSSSIPCVALPMDAPLLAWISKMDQMRFEILIAICQNFQESDMVGG